MQAVLEYLKQDYGNPPIYIYENALSLSLSLSHTHTYTYTPFFFHYLFFGGGILEETLWDSKKTLQDN